MQEFAGAYDFHISVKNFSRVLAEMSFILEMIVSLFGNPSKITSELRDRLLYTG